MLHALVMTQRCLLFPLIHRHASSSRIPSLLRSEHAARERARQKLLNELYAARTRGIKTEAAILLECGRVLAKEAVSDSKLSASQKGVTARRWASHVCFELRRNRFAAQRGAMRRKVFPTRAPDAALAPPRITGNGRARSMRSPASATSEASTGSIKRQVVKQETCSKINPQYR